MHLLLENPQTRTADQEAVQVIISFNLGCMGATMNFRVMLAVIWLMTTNLANSAS